MNKTSKITKIGHSQWSIQSDSVIAVIHFDELSISSQATLKRYQ